MKTTRFRIKKVGCAKQCRCPCSEETRQWCMKRCGGYIVEIPPKYTSSVKQPTVSSITVQPTTEKIYVTTYICVMLALFAVILLYLSCILKKRRQLGRNNDGNRQFVNYQSVQASKDVDVTYTSSLPRDVYSSQTQTTSVSVEYRTGQTSPTEHCQERPTPQCRSTACQTFDTHDSDAGDCDTDDSDCLKRLTLECSLSPMTGHTSDALQQPIQECWSTHVEAPYRQLDDLDCDSEDDTLVKASLPTPVSCEVSNESCERDNEDLETCDPSFDLSANSESTLDKIASLPGVTFAMLVAGDKLVIGVNNEAIIPAVKNHIQTSTNLRCDEYKFEVQNDSRVFELLSGSTSGDVVHVRNGKWKTGALTCFCKVHDEEYALSIGHMFGDDDKKEIYTHTEIDGPVFGEWIAKIMKKTPNVIDALLIKISQMDIVCRNIAKSTGAARIEMVSDITRFEGEPVQKYGHHTGLTRGTLQSARCTLTIPDVMEDPHYKIGDKLKGVIVVTTDDDDFFVHGECGALLTTVPNDSGTVFILGALFSREFVRKDDKLEHCKYYACNLSYLLKILPRFELNKITPSVAPGISTGPFFRNDIDLLLTGDDCDSEFVTNKD